MQQTDKYKLNKPGVDDPIAIAPLNENMDKIEAALTAEAAALDTRITVLELHKIVFGTYLGNGKKEGEHQFIDLGFTPVAVIAQSADIQASAHISIAFADSCMYYSNSLYPKLSVADGGFIAYRQFNSEQCVNVSGKLYHYIAFT